MQVQLKNNAFTATQWFKDGDHPAVTFYPEFIFKEKFSSLPERTIEARYGIVTVYDFDDMDSSIEPGMWIVEMFDGIHLYSDEDFKKLFTDERRN